MSIEELEDVLTEMDGECGDMYDGTITLGEERYRSYIQRIRDAVEIPPEILAMREALKRCEAISHLPEIREQQCVKDMRNLVDSALAAPARNCDVGTAEEQKKRFVKFCQAHHEYWKPSKSLTAIQKCNCPCQEGNSCNHFIWAQMPYKDGENDGNE